jgi:hypothetical protein
LLQEDFPGISDNRAAVLLMKEHEVQGIGLADSVRKLLPKARLVLLQELPEALDIPVEEALRKRVAKLKHELANGDRILELLEKTLAWLCTELDYPEAEAFKIRLREIMIANSRLIISRSPLFVLLGN